MDDKPHSAKDVSVADPVLVLQLHQHRRLLLLWISTLAAPVHAVAVG